MPILPYSDAERMRFADFAELYLACRDAFRDITEETQMRLVPGSRAAGDEQHLLARDPPVPERARHIITFTVGSYLYAASEHISGLSALYARDEVLLAPIVLGRSAIELCAHTIWILGTSRDDAEDRLARAFLEELSGARRVRTQAERLFGQASEQHRSRTEYYEEVLSDARSLFQLPYRDPLNTRPFMLGGHSLPPFSEVVAHMDRATTRPLAGDVMLGTYGLLSSHVHPTPHVIRELFDVRYEDGEPIATLARDLSFHERLTKLVVVPFYNALTYVMSYHGWAPTRHSELTMDIDRLLPDVFVAGPAAAPFDRAL